MTFIEEMRAIGPGRSWQITPPQDYKDRMASDGHAATPPGGYPLTNHGGSVLAHPKLFIIYCGPWWGDTAKLEQYAKELMSYGYLSPLSAYGSGQGSFIGSFLTATVTGTVDDAALQGILKDLIAKKSVPAPDGNTLYAMLLMDGVTVTQGGSSSCGAFCGYHGNLDAQTFYSVQPSTGCATCNMGDAFAAFTMVLGHEVAEACTDAIPGEGWFNDATGMENADEWAWDPKPYGPWTVQPYQVNGVGADFGPYAAPSPTPQPQPQPQPACSATVDQYMNAMLATVSAGNYLPNGVAWLTWAKQTLDFYLGSKGMSAPKMPARPGLLARIRRMF